MTTNLTLYNDARHSEEDIYAYEWEDLADGLITNEHGSVIKLLCDQIFDYSEKRRLELPLIDKSSSLSLYKEKTKEWEYLADTHWFFSSELYKAKELIESLAGQSSVDISDASIILFRDITKIIHAIDNRLELRGRDSFGLSISLSSSHFSQKKIDTSNIIGNNEDATILKNLVVDQGSFKVKFFTILS